MRVAKICNFFQNFFWSPKFDISCFGNEIYSTPKISLLRDSIDQLTSFFQQKFTVFE